MSRRAAHRLMPLRDAAGAAVGRARHARGVALLTALLVVAIATLLLAGLLDRGEVALARAQNVTRGAQADALAQGVEDWALQVLRRDAAGPEVDKRGDIWAQPLPPTEVPGGKLSGVMRDLNGCLNVNELWHDGQIDAVASGRMARLLNLLRLEDDLRAAMIDWIDADGQPSPPRGAEDAMYAAAQPPYRTPNRPMAHISELRLLRGMTAEAYQALLPHVCALPTLSPLNVNTATPEVLASLSPQIDLAFAKRIVQEGGGFSSVQEFKDYLFDGAVVVPDQELLGLGIESQYFVARADIELDGLVFTPVALLFRDRESVDYRVVARGRGGF